MPMAEDAKRKRRYEKGCGKDGRQPRQEIRGAAAAHKAASAAAHAERSAFGTLQQDDHDHRKRGHDIDDKKDCDHGM